MKHYDVMIVGAGIGMGVALKDFGITNYPSKNIRKYQRWLKKGIGFK